MPCLLGCLALGTPRVILFFLFLFTDYLGVYQTNFWPFVGFFFAPVTTLAYAVAINEHGRVEGLWLVLLIFAIAVDVGLIRFGSTRRYRRGGPPAPPPPMSLGGGRTIDVGGERVG
jgi:hypothetical protein